MRRSRKPLTGEHPFEGSNPSLSAIYQHLENTDPANANGHSAGRDLNPTRGFEPSRRRARWRNAPVRRTSPCQRAQQSLPLRHPSPVCNPAPFNPFELARGRAMNPPKPATIPTCIISNKKWQRPKHPVRKSRYLCSRRSWAFAAWPWSGMAWKNNWTCRT